MRKYLIFFIFLGLGFASRSQVHIPETDALTSKVILVLPGVSTTQLAAVKTEFLKYSQIQKATFVYKDHNCLIIDLNMNSNNLVFTTYANIIKIMSVAIPEDKILIKNPIAYSQINDDIDSTSYTVK
jgi:hypothetical protein